MAESEKQAIAEALEEIAVLLEMKGEEAFRCRAYQKGARAVAAIEGDLREIWKEGRLIKEKGIGKGLAEKIEEYLEDGKIGLLEDLRQEFPAGLLELLKIPGLGPKKIKILHEALQIASLEDLEKACLDNRLPTLEGFGVKTQEKILKGIEHVKRSLGRVLLHQAYPAALALVKDLRALREVQQADIAGSLRRWKETVKDVDLVAASEESGAVMEAFATHPLAVEVIARGETKTSIRLGSGLQVDLRVVKPSEYACTLAHFTGSKEHNTVMRQRAKERGWKLNEYGLFDGEAKKPVASEGDLYHALGLVWIPPEMREDHGEFEKAEKGPLPRLVERSDITGIFHAHSTYSDGAASLHEMAEATRALGLSYLGITDHSRSAFYAGGLSIDRVREQHKEIELLNTFWPATEFQIFKGIEADILPDGSLDYPNEILDTFDFVIASVHSHFHLTEAEMTRRIIQAIEHPKTRMLGHVTGRLLLSREGYPVDLRAVIDAAIQHRVVVELNANPHRLDLDWRFLSSACDRGLLTSINPDAHTTEGLKHLLYGVHQARKAGLPKEAILNTRSLPEIQVWLESR